MKALIRLCDECLIHVRRDSSPLFKHSLELCGIVESRLNARFGNRITALQHVHRQANPLPLEISVGTQSNLSHECMQQEKRGHVKLVGKRIQSAGGVGAVGESLSHSAYQ